MAQKFAQATVTGVAAYPTEPQVTIPFCTLSVTIRNPLASGDGAVLSYSFDGVTEHGRLDKGESFTQQPWAGANSPAPVGNVGPQTKVWLKESTAPALGDTVARVWGWA